MMYKKMMTSKKGRKCKHPGCKHILSIYNHEVNCNLHADSKQSASASATSRSKSK